MVVPDFDVLIPEAKKAGIEESDRAKLCHSTEVRNMIFKDLTEMAKKAKLHGFEFVKG